MMKKLTFFSLIMLVITACINSTASSPDEALLPAEADEVQDEGITHYEYLAPGSGKNEILIRHTGYTCSFNKDRLTPNYIAWWLDRQRVDGPAKRSNIFNPDNALPAEYRVTTNDYSGSGYDRGHMCPAADNRQSQHEMDECFLMSNMCPQAHNLNSGPWNDLEIQCRRWAKDLGLIYIVAGPIYDSSSPKRIGKGSKRIAVPDRFFKVVLYNGKQNGGPRAIGFIYENDDLDGEIADFAVTVDKVEKITGFDFFSQLPDDVENRIEANGRISDWKVTITKEGRKNQNSNQKKKNKSYKNYKQNNKNRNRYNQF